MTAIILEPLLEGGNGMAVLVVLVLLLDVAALLYVKFNEVRN